MARRALLLLTSLALAAPAPALAAEANGGTGIPVDGSGGVKSIPGDPAAPEQTAPTPSATRAAQPRSAATPRSPSADHAPVASSTQAGGDDGDAVKVPVPRSDGSASHRPSAVAPPSLPSTGFDLGVFVAVGMGMLGVGLLLSAVVGPRPPKRAA